MLNKEIWLRCYLRDIRLDGMEGNHFDFKRGDRETFERRWENGWVHCCSVVGLRDPITDKSGWTYIIEPPPGNCLYLLEHVVGQSNA